MTDDPGTVIESEGRLDRLLDAVVAVASDLSLPDVLRRIAESARELVGARYGALGVLDPSGQWLSSFITAHRATFGFPRHHPTMTSFLGVPVRVRGRVFGNLYLTDKHGGGEFTGEDQDVGTALSATAGVAIENARRYDRSVRREHWPDAARQVTEALLRDGRPVDAMQLIAEHARKASNGASSPWPNRRTAGCGHRNTHEATSM